MMGADPAGKVIYEPSAGNGNIVDWCKEHGAKEVLVSEKHPELAMIVQRKGKFIGHDCFDVLPAHISHVDMIIMNPPFSNGHKHLMYAWEIAPEGCEIYCLLNWQTVNNAYSQSREEMLRIIADYGSAQNLGRVFGEAERETEVEVGLVKLFKPKTGSREFEGFFLEEDQPEAQTGPGIMPYNVVRDVVQRYVDSVKIFEEFEGMKARMDQRVGCFELGSLGFYVGRTRDKSELMIYTKDNFKRELQKNAWKFLFDKMKLNKFVTSGVMNDINKFVENQQAVPFTMRNIYRMFEIIVGTRQETFNRSLVEAVDKFTKYTDENRYGLEGWKTNSGHLLNKVFIIPRMTELGFDGQVGLHYGGDNDRKLDDLNKVLCSLTGKNFDHMISIYQHVHYTHKLYSGEEFICADSANPRNPGAGMSYEYEKRKKALYDSGRPIDEKISKVEWGQWSDWGFFQIRPYKKGTMHFKFKDLKVWELLNRKYAEIKGHVLPEKI